MELVNWFKSERENSLQGSVVMSSDRAEYFQQRAADTDSHSVNTPGRQRLSSSAPVNKFHLKTAPWWCHIYAIKLNILIGVSLWRFHVTVVNPCKTDGAWSPEEWKQKLFNDTAVEFSRAVCAVLESLESNLCETSRPDLLIGVLFFQTGK